MTILNLFPTPVYQSHFNNSIEIEMLLNEITFVKNTGGNFCSKDQNVLEHEMFCDLKASILENVNNYFLQIVRPKFEVLPYITTSWINLGPTGSTHHEHSHSNSFCSGVFYLQADQSNDNITFYNSRYQQIKIYTEDYNLYNSDSWSVPVNTGDILIFPSYLNHAVTKTTSDSRISLAFNVFVKGVLGNNCSNNLVL
jgi:uncharacterized protein (TIGR02466 family)